MSAVLHDEAHPPGGRVPPLGTPRREEALIDQALVETFPASDPISPAVEMPAVSPGPTARGPIERRARWSARVARTAPALIGFGTFALALSLMRAARRRSGF